MRLLGRLYHGFYGKILLFLRSETVITVEISIGLSAQQLQYRTHRVFLFFLLAQRFERCKGKQCLARNGFAVWCGFALFDFFCFAFFFFCLFLAFVFAFVLIVELFFVPWLHRFGWCVCGFICFFYFVASCRCLCARCACVLPVGVRVYVCEYVLSVLCVPACVLTVRVRAHNFFNFYFLFVFLILFFILLWIAGVCVLAVRACCLSACVCMCVSTCCLCSVCPRAC